MMNGKASEGGPPPWIEPEMQRQIEWRDKDILISVPIKSGTTWTMNIVHQLLTGGDADFEDIYVEVPWIELMKRPEMPVEELLGQIGGMSAERPRAFKSHSAPPDLPFVEPDRDIDVRYVVVFRNPEEALVSLKPFIEQHSERWFDLWQVPREMFVKADFQAFYHEVIDVTGMNAALFDFLNSWWPLRDRPNVLFMHFGDMKRDHEGSVRRIADFIGARPTAGQWRSVCEYTSFRWMKANSIKFDGRRAADIPVLEPGAMIRKGKVGSAREDGMTQDISSHLRALGSRVCPDEEARQWFYEGGPLPT